MGNDITQPLRLAVGSHSAGSGYGCAMNVISWENGDQTITDMPDCTHPALAGIVYTLNDEGCEHATPVTINEGTDQEEDGWVLCAECSVKVLDFAHQTVGTNFRYKTKPDWRKEVLTRPFKWYIKGIRKLYFKVMPEWAQREIDFGPGAVDWYGRPLSSEDQMVRQLGTIQNWVNAGRDLDDKVKRATLMLNAFKEIFADRIKSASEVRFKRDLEAAIKLMQVKTESTPKDANEILAFNGSIRGL